MKKYLVFLCLLPALCHAALACVTGYRVESSDTATGATWTMEGNLPATANMLALQPSQTRYYRIVMKFSDGSSVTSAPVLLTVTTKPLPPIDLKLLFADVPHG